MDMKQYAGTRFLKVDDFRDKPPRQFKIAEVAGKSDRANLIFEDGKRASLNQTNTNALIDECGEDSDAWIGQVVELSFGHAGNFDIIVVRPVSKPSHYGEAREAHEAQAAARKPDMDDEIPF